MQSTNSSMRQTIGTQRIETLVDGVFAIVLTLLVLDIHAPQASSEIDLLKKLWALRENIFSYIVSFVVLGTFWYGHTIEFHYIQRSERIHAGINLVFLLCIAFIPFSASLIGQDGQFRTASAIYGLNLLFTVIVRYWHWHYVSSGHRLIDIETEAFLIRKIRRRLFVVPFAYLFAIVVSLLNARIGLLLYVLIPVLYIHRVGNSIVITSAEPQGTEIE